MSSFFNLWKRNLDDCINHWLKGNFNTKISVFVCFFFFCFCFFFFFFFFFFFYFVLLFSSLSIICNVFDMFFFEVTRVLLQSLLLLSCNCLQETISESIYHLLQYLEVFLFQNICRLMCTYKQKMISKWERKNLIFVKPRSVC